MSLADLHTPVDVEAQYDAWGANCGPACLAAALGMRVADVRPLVEPFRGYMGIPQMKAALHRRHTQLTLGHRVGEFWEDINFGRRIWALDEHALLSVALWTVIKHDVTAMPLLLAWDGPWRDVPRAVAAHRHWLAVAPVVDSDVYVYDVNASWQTLREWCETTARELVPKRGTGGFVVQWGARLLHTGNAPREGAAS